MPWSFACPSSCQMLVLVAFTLLSALVEGTRNLSGASWGSTAYEWGLLGRYPQQSFKSAPLHPPLTNTVQWDEQCAQGYTLLSLRGTAVSEPAAIMLGGHGELVWMDESFGPYVMNLKVQKYKGEQYLTFWSGDISLGFGLGTYYMLDSHYQVFKQFSAASTLENDFHEYAITTDNTALLTSYDTVARDLSTLGVEGQGWIYDSLFREVDIETGEIIFEWRASDHFAVNDTYYPIDAAGRSPEAPFDFFHINSVDKDINGDYIVSSRFMHSIACISARTGKLLWTLGGRNNDFEDLSDGYATDFAWQHHVSVQDDNRLSIFDNTRYRKWHEELLESNGEISRGLLVQLDTDNMTVELVQEYMNPGARGSPQQGSMQVLNSGNVLLGWGYHAGFTEYSSDGAVLCDIHINPAMFFPFGFVHSYRAFRAATWIGRPNTQPDIYLDHEDGYAFVSWNGATEVTGWKLQTANATSGDKIVFTDAVNTNKDGFETKIEMPDGDYGFLRIIAVDKAGNVLASSKTVAANKISVPAASRKWKYAVVALMFWIVCFVTGFANQKGLRALIQTGQQKAGSRFRSRGWKDIWISGSAKSEEEERLYPS
ncbi:hypothetical protein AUEXF2481DRAFT_90828 [Aureobasidium subglaciale EXF-2481]|uniref:Arylsulfotransferase n=1 Tax=Aureobasidium subglaciale (strain EXF-2481) TaxID=1043005 RepID=A0A074Y686_AURSE|nr:uncharacterized protein AUEXF2481DRAFT_90828 [Aureobasidium subglaciale EXF-2481]KAI5206990.1 hypothetical protein E4T38_03512 [Aureobasidium subglaciale]KAI5225660.1 hypothetical protein E4T40_03287 [Aureobasidium subglaciale]KAI5229080.1 hypothetical protein E4T41_03650 [Aureobasidium subglaciale]KAI5263919.1 hypothetical protein E4T46_03286 [Aureobasidium subglaciale]KEQ93210.1 hypothetical protein AUEXF2481DRAFT_90828 [Aureobasidium subglaciale EXF-2481]